MDIEIQITERDAKAKRDARRLRRVGSIPVIIYTYTKEGDTVSEKCKRIYRRFVQF